jgi:dihydroflavonol-4-reductase
MSFGAHSMSESVGNGKVLVTGGSGFVGSHLVDHLLEQRKAIRCLVRSSSNLQYLKHPRIEFVYGGLDGATDWDEALQEVDIVYHVAGLTSARRPEHYFAVNHRGTETILAAALKYRRQIKKFVLISSLAAVGPSKSGHPVNEQTTPAPISPYGRSKLMGEEALHAIGDLVPWTIVRPPAVYGPRDYALFEIFKSVAKGISPMIGKRDKRVSLVHASDLARGIALAGESEASTGRTYFISSDEVYSLSSIAALLAKILGRPAKTIVIPKPVAYCLAVAAEGMAMVTGKRPVINRDKVRDLSQTGWGCSIDKAKRELGYAQQVPLEEGLRETVNWYKEAGWL